MRQLKVFFQEEINIRRSSSKGKYGGQLSIAGGICLHLVMGSFYMWGAFCVYVISYFRQFDEPLRTKITPIAFPLFTLFGGIAMQFNLYLIKKLTLKGSLLLGSSFVVFGTFFSSFVTNFYLFVFLYIILFSFANGLLYMIPPFVLSKYYPTHKGLMSGITFGAFGLGGLITSQIVQELTNPNNEVPTVIDLIHNDKYFQPSVYQNVPSTIRWVSLYYLILLSFAFVFITKKHDNEQHELHEHSLSAAAKKPVLKEENQVEYNLEQKNQAKILAIQEIQSSDSEVKSTTESNIFDKHQDLDEVRKFTELHDVADECTSVGDGLRSRTFLCLFLFNMGACCFGYTIASNYKIYGFAENISSDKILTLAGSLGSLFNGVTRMLWGLLFDKVGVKRIYYMVLSIQLSIIIILPFVGQVPACFVIIVIINFIQDGAIYSVGPPATIHSFNSITVGTRIYSVTFWAFMLGNFLQFFTVYLLRPRIGFDATFKYFIPFNLLAFVAVYLYKPYQRQSTIEKEKLQAQLNQNHSQGYVKL